MTSQDEFMQDVLKGLSLPQKALSPKWLYDDQGSQLFEDITQLPEYYPTRTEAEIFKSAFPALREKLGTGIAIAEYGSGASVKTRRLLDILEPEVYVPIDIAKDFLYESAQALKSDYPEVDVTPVVGDFTQTIPLPPEFLNADHRLGFFPGSTIGNMSPEAATKFLNDARSSLSPGAKFLLGADLVKDIAILEAAYDDAAGITARFNLNLLTRINRELGANFELSAFTHRAVFNEDQSRIEMHLVAETEQSIRIQDQTFIFTAGESLHTENSYKFSTGMIKELAALSGWRLETYWTDVKDWFGVFLLA